MGLRFLAHAAPVKLDPPSGAAVAPGEVTLRLGMSQPVELPFSKVTLRGPDRTWNADLRLEGDRTVAAVLPELAPGRYDVTWRVLSVDGHLTEGTYYVTVSTTATARTMGSIPAVARTDFTLLIAGALVLGLAVVWRLRRSLIRG